MGRGGLLTSGWVGKGVWTRDLELLVEMGLEHVLRAALAFSEHIL